MNVRQLIQEIVRTDSNTRVGVVVSVDADATCTINLPDTDTDLPGVRIQLDEDNGVYYAPKIGSNVLLHRISDFDWVIIMYSAIDNIQFLDGSFGGLVKTQELKTQLDKTNQVLSAIQNVLTTWSPVANDGGAALKTAAIAALAGKTAGDYSQIENTRITHGDI